MRVNLQLFKKTGKWYADAVAEIPDTVELWDDNLYETLMQAQDSVFKTSSEFIMVINLDEDDSDRLGGKFMIRMLFPKGMRK